MHPSIYFDDAVCLIICNGRARPATRGRAGCYGKVASAGGVLHFGVAELLDALTQARRRQRTPWKNIRISADILWRVFRISTEPVRYTLVSVNRWNLRSPGWHYVENSPQQICGYTDIFYSVDTKRAQRHAGDLTSVGWVASSQWVDHFRSASTIQKLAREKENILPTTVQWSR